MHKRFLTALSWILLPVCSLAQQVPNMDNYQPARSNGELPPDVLQTTTEKYERSKTKINTGQSEELQKAEDDFYLQTNYQVDQILHSGSIMVGDSMGMYVNRVADSLLANDPETRAQINIYILRSATVNAFATDRGSIFVTIGLLTRLRNEAELAYVLAHEIIHYKRRHVLTGYIEGVQMQKGDGKYAATTFENRYLKKHSYARNQETQADEEGFDMLVASNYDPRAAMGAFDILAMADFPFTDTLFSKSLFEAPNFVFPSKYYSDTIKEYRIDDQEEDNDLATHPSVYKRRKNIKKRFTKLEGGDTLGAKFLVSESLFYRVRARAMFEEAALWTNEGTFKEGVYINQAIQKTYPNNYYLRKEMVRALYAVTIKKNVAFSFGDLEELLSALFSGEASLEGDERPTGEMERATLFMGKTDREGWNVAAAKYAWAVHKQFPVDKDIALWSDGLFQELTVNNDIRLKDFSKNDSLFVLIGNKVLADTGLVKKVKNNTPEARFQVVLDNMNEDSLQDVEYWEFAFIEELKDSVFVQMFRSAMEFADSLQLIADAKEFSGEKNSKKERKQREEELYGPQGLSKVVFVNPIYQTYDSRIENGQLDVRKSIAGRFAMMQAMTSSAKAMGMECEILDPENMDSTNVDKFNDLMLMSNWFAQKGNFKENDPLPVEQEQMNSLAKKYGTKYFMWIAYHTSRIPRTGKLVRALSLAFVPLAPLTAYRLFTPREDIYFVAICYDITTGKMVWAVEREIEKQKATDARLQLQMYDMMRMLASPKKVSK